MKREHTLHGPARYLPGTNIADVETSTVRAPDRHLASEGHLSEYVRQTGVVIGWDLGRDAMLSFVECSGGVGAGRAYHGRPMAEDNPKLRNQKA